ncbi:MAG: sulfatase-like hydrolase/transferase [Fidelibacterota bacterium]|nr:MAG: sulfatase-like hydrolase/transferase [Candidatus Neomarinimicrobiota bacterium]
MSTQFNRRDFLKTIGLGTAALALPGCVGPRLSSGGKLPAARPNIILIMADDMGFSDLGCYGGEILTPNLDRLAAGGIRFARFYNAARCCPTRASLLTGLYPHQAGMGDMVSRPGSPKPPGPYQGFLNDRCVTIAEVLREAGYHTLMSGKWHVGESRPHWPTDRGFDRYYGLVSGAANYFDITKSKAIGRIRVFAIDDQPHMPPNQGFYMTDAITENAVGYLDQYARGDTPFFLYVAYTAPHWPLHALPEDIARYRGKYLHGWDAMRRRRYERLIEMGIINDSWPLSPRDADVSPWDEVADKEEMDLKMAVYAAQVDRMDQGIGKILDALKVSGKEENTLVLFLSDNGGCHEGGPWGFDNRENGLPPGGVDSFMSYGSSWANASNTPFRLYKHWVHEGGIATPLIACWPAGIRQQGHITHQPGHVIDLMATCRDLAGATYPETYRGKEVLPLEGRSLRPVFQGEQRQGHDVLYWEHEGNKAIRRGKWKLVSVSEGRWELYDLEADRTELRDLAGQQPELAGELAGLYQAWAARCGVKD